MHSKKKDKPTTFNRLILVGNGFDLAAGIKSSYVDFLNFIHRKALTEALSNGAMKFQNGLISVNVQFRIDDNQSKKIIDALNNSELLFQINQIAKANGLQIEIVSPFLKKLIDEFQKKNWVDIESLYYKELRILYDNYQKAIEKYKDQIIKRTKSLNSQIGYLETELNEFIRQSQTSFVYNSTNPGEIGELFDSAFSGLESRPKVDKTKLPDTIEAPKTILFLNFNYTGIISEMRRQRKSPSLEIHIHGSVSCPVNTIIFGYGDDTSSTHRDMELTEEDEFLKKIKSFQYNRTDNYHQLLSFLDSDYFEVFIWGHSCGLSDKTMLSTIFEHDNCLSIKNFNHKGIEGHVKKGMAIARHFNDKKKMRDRLLNFDQKAKMPSAK